WWQPPRETGFPCDSFQDRDSEAMAPELVAVVEQVRAAVTFEQVGITQHVGIPARDRHIDADPGVVPHPPAQILRPCVPEAVSACLVCPKIRRLAVAEDHVKAITDSRHGWERLALVNVQAIVNDLPSLLFFPYKAVMRNGVPDLVGTLGRCACLGTLPVCPEDVPHVKLIVMKGHKRVADEEGLMERGRKDRAVADPSECESVIVALGHTHGGLHGD